MVAPVKKEVPNKNTANGGDRIAFTYQKIKCIGEVVAVYINSVCVEILEHNGIPKKGEIPERTIVSYKRYKVL